MHILLLCATHRGYRFAESVFRLGSGHDFTVFSFRETPWEPAYLDDIRNLTVAYNHRFIEARNVARPSLRDFWQQNDIDLIFMVSWRYMVPPDIYRRARLGSYVFHDSLLPRYRGFAPTVWAMINGETETGVTLFRTADELDAGDILDQRRIAIGKCDTIADVMERLTLVYLEMVESNFSSLLAGSAKSYSQDNSLATYTCKWTPADAQIIWSKSAREIYNVIRATSQPYPGAYTYLDGQKITIWSAELPTDARRYVASVPGRVAGFVSDEGATVLTGDGSIVLKAVQLEGQPIVNASRLLTSPSLTLGDRPRP